MVRRMREPAYRAEQWRDRYATHIEPINRLVDELGAQAAAGRPPYVAPMYRGVHAPVLAILRDPGPMAAGVQGSGFLSVENDDQTAERQCGFFAEAGIDPADVVPWNAYPWYINDTPSRTQLAEGVEPLRRLIALMPGLRVVLPAGKDAQAAWQLFSSRHGALIRARGIEAISTYHPSRQALQHPDPAERSRREEHIRATLRRAALLIGSGGRSAAAPSDPSSDAVSALSVVDVAVAARPATFATAAEAAWRDAVAAAVGTRHVPDGTRFAVEIEFRLPPPRTRNDAWDLDNLLKPTLDALGGVIGWRRWNGRPQADDERIDRIVASKRAVEPDEDVGARIRIAALNQPRESIGL
jgi:Holliday junction resolvase RusA-like endonuclease